MTYEEAKAALKSLIESETIINPKSGKPPYRRKFKSFRETANLNNRLSKKIGNFMRENRGNIDDLGENYVKLMYDYYDELNKIMSETQKFVDNAMEINMQPAAADFPEERVKKAADSLGDETVDEETLDRRAKSATENIGRSMHDDYIHKNAKVRTKAGIKCHITRIPDSDCCRWCSSLGGKYLYGYEPQDVYRRHDNCACLLIYESGREVRDVWTNQRAADAKRHEEEYENRMKKFERTGVSDDLSRAENYRIKFEKRQERINERVRTFEEVMRKKGFVKNEFGDFVFVGKSKKNTLTSGGNDDIINEKSSKQITQITDANIEKIPPVKIQGYTDEQCKVIQQQHKELLKYARDANDNKEVAFVFDNNLGNRREFKGEDDRLDFGSALYGKDLFVMHNHPRNSSYSDTDIAFLLSMDNLKSLSIVKNNGSIEILTKTSKYDKEYLVKEFKRQYKKCVKTGSANEIDKAVKTFITRNEEMIIWNKNQ